MANGTWKIARGKGSAQLPLAIVAVLAVVLVLLGKAQSQLFDRARAEFSDWTAPALEAVRAPLDSASRWIGGIGGIFTVYEDNLRLKEENARLRQWQSAAMLLQQRLDRYRLLLNAVPDPALSSVTAHVIGRASRPFLDTMILDAGTTGGIHPGEAVVDTRGMVGRIFLSGERTSWVILLTDLNSRIPVRVIEGNIHAILAGDNSPAPVLETLSDPDKVHQGDQVVTSGDGGLLPPGLPVGVIVKDAGGFRVALYADPATSQDVRIVDYQKPPEAVPKATLNDLPAGPMPGKAAAKTAEKAQPKTQNAAADGAQ
jgi:rod shape-determining protein MreC